MTDQSDYYERVQERAKTELQTPAGRLRADADSLAKRAEQKASILRDLADVLTENWDRATHVDWIEIVSDFKEAVAEYNDEWRAIYDEERQRADDE